jgi:hypothetical protein
MINQRLLKEAVHQLKCPLCKLFNLSLSIGVLPSDWKKGNVTPVYKNNNPNDVKTASESSRSVYIGKKLLNSFALSKSLKIKLLFFSNGGMP